MVAINFKELEKEFEIFANEHRLAILKCLKNGKSKCVGGISDEINLSFKITSKHLLYLAEQGILSRHYDGPFVLYSISDNLSSLNKTIISYL
ncbi:MAG: ArsR family transcriptional regulator [Candidatus Paceibacterota bacterium]|jgi:DNA-binding transcriptional ArsR family regulator